MGHTRHRAIDDIIMSGSNFCLVIVYSVDVSMYVLRPLLGGPVATVSHKDCLVHTAVLCNAITRAERRVLDTATSLVGIGRHETAIERHGWLAPIPRAKPPVES